MSQHETIQSAGIHGGHSDSHTGEMECSQVLVHIYTVREQLNLSICCWSWCM
jgi:hypothetical protein